MSEPPSASPFPEGAVVRVKATGATGIVVDIDLRYGSVDVDLGDGITAEFEWDELELVTSN